MIKGADIEDSRAGASFSAAVLPETPFSIGGA